VSETCPNCGLTVSNRREEQKRRDASIVAAHRSGTSAKALAIDFDLHVTRINQIIRAANKDLQ
jgi:hypothetical protein